MKKIKLLFEILGLILGYLRTCHLRKCMDAKHGFVKDERVGTVFVFGPREGIKEETIQQAFPRASIHFQCPPADAICPLPYEPHRLVGETMACREKQMVVFVNPWEADPLEPEELSYKVFNPTKLLFLISWMTYEWGQRIVLVSYREDELKPQESYFRELSRPRLIRFMMKSRLKELFGFSPQSFTKAATAFAV